MFIPREYQVTDEERLYDVVRRYPLGTIVSAENRRPPVATLVPFLLREEDGHRRLWGHMARQNPQWGGFRPDRELLCVFKSDDHYVSPSWYVNVPYAPTWNFIHVHLYGRPRLLGNSDEERARWILEQTVEEYESRRRAPWELTLPEDYFARMLPRVKAFEIEVTRIEGQFKLSQDKPLEDRLAVIAELERLDGSAPGVARLMRAELEREQG